MKKLLLILSLFIAVTFSFQQCKAQVNHLFWAHNNNEFAGYGLLYNWYAATDARNIAPVGFHVPTQAEYAAMATYLSTNVGGKLKETALIFWQTPNSGATNETGFNGRGSGYREASGTFSHFNTMSRFICYNQYNASLAYLYELASNSSDLNINAEDKKIGFSLRFVADSGTPTTATGNDGKVYPCVTIGSQTWTAENSAETLYRDGTPIPEVTDNTDWSNLTTGGACYYNNNPKYK